MSTEYKVICLTHDPAIVIAGSWNGAEGAVAAAAAARNPATNRATLAHQGCDLMVGRWSGGLVELWCLGAELPYNHAPYHREERRQDANWLRLLIRGNDSTDSSVVEAANEIQANIGGCWSPTRLRRLRIELGTAHPDELAAEPWRSTRGWLADCDEVVIDPDGWRDEDAPDLDQPISRTEFLRRLAMSTTARRDSALGTERGNIFLETHRDPGH